MQVRSFIPDSELEEVAAIVVDDPLRPDDELVEEEVSLGVLIEVDAAEPNEHRDRRAQLAQEVTSPGPQSFVDSGQEPLAYDVARQPWVGQRHG